jgi:hypothetical protein
MRLGAGAAIVRDIAPAAVMNYPGNIKWTMTALRAGRWYTVKSFFGFFLGTRRRIEAWEHTHDGPKVPL